MDKKELNDLIDRVVLTGPGGIDKIKKVLKELAKGGGSDGGSGSGSGSSPSSPMIVVGSMNVPLPSEQYFQFTPIDNQPSLDEAIQHFISGRTVLLQEDTDGVTHFVEVIEYKSTENGSGLIASSPSQRSVIIWSSISSEDSGGSGADPDK